MIIDCSMRNKFHLLLLVFITLSFFTTGLRAEEDSPLEKQMQILARGIRQLNQQVTNPAKKQSSIDLLETLKKAAVDSKSLEPRMTRNIPADKKSAFLADYRTDLDELKDSLNQIEDAVKTDQYDKAASLFSAVNSIKREAHSKFKQD